MYRLTLHEKDHALRWGYCWINSDVALAWDGGGLRPIDDRCGFDALQREFYIMTANEELPRWIILRGKAGRWTMASRQTPGVWGPLWKRRALFVGPPDAWPMEEKCLRSALAQRGFLT